MSADEWNDETPRGFRRTTPRLGRIHASETRGTVMYWDGRHGVIRTEEGIDIDFFPVHLAANGYTGPIRVGDRIFFRCCVVCTREYCLDVIRAVALA
jgi:hypothetical protein